MNQQASRWLSAATLLQPPYSNGLALWDCETALPCEYYILFLAKFTDTIVGILPTRPRRANRVALALWDPRRSEDRASWPDFTREEPSRCCGSCCCRAGPKACRRFREEARYLEGIWRIGGVSKYVINSF